MSEIQSDDPNVLTDIEVDEPINKSTRERAGASNFPAMFESVESLPHCFPLGKTHSFFELELLDF